MIIWIAPVLLWLHNKGSEYLDFLRSIPSLLAPKPVPLGAPYTPPYTGGQCPTSYHIRVQGRVYFPNGGLRGTIAEILSVPTNWNLVTKQGAITDVSPFNSPSTNGGQTGFKYTANGVQGFFGVGGYGDGTTIIIDGVQVVRTDGLPDNCGDLNNPVPPPPIADDGLFNPQNPAIGDNNGNVNQSAIVLAPALPLVLVSAILAGYSAAMAAAAAASDALAAIKKIAEGLDALKTLWEKLKEFLDEWEKNRPKKRDVVRQTYGRILGDGALDFFPNNNTKFKAIQLDVVITNIPVGFGRYFGSLSPSRYRYKELGYIAFYSANQGILEVHSIQFKRTSYQIPELAVGFIYHLGLDEQVKGYAFGTFSVEKT